MLPKTLARPWASLRRVPANTQQVVCLGAAEQMSQSLNSASVCSFDLWPITTCKQLVLEDSWTWIYVLLSSIFHLEWKYANLLFCMQECKKTWLTWLVLSPTAATPGSSCRSQHFPLQEGTAETKHGVSDVLSVLAPPNTCKSGGVALVKTFLGKSIHRYMTWYFGKNTSNSNWNSNAYALPLTWTRFDCLFEPFNKLSGGWQSQLDLPMHSCKLNLNRRKTSDQRCWKGSAQHWCPFQNSLSLFFESMGKIGGAGQSCSIAPWNDLPGNALAAQEVAFQTC